MNLEPPPVICIVDDDVSVRRSLARLIASFGLSVETYASAPEFLSAAHPNGIACLILDVHLGAMSGFELYEHLEVTTCVPPVIFITAHDDAATREQARLRGASSYVRKPFEASLVLAEIGRTLGRDLEERGFGSP